MLGRPLLVGHEQDHVHALQRGGRGGLGGAGGHLAGGGGGGDGAGGDGALLEELTAGAHGAP
ncbi:MAG: hypothetical protein FJW78_06645 [Actinobacteria bacterium]|nr:hypothetical protein [Actinomycetota bacterium]